MSGQLSKHEFNELSAEQKIEKGLEITQSLISGKKMDENEMFEIPDDLQSFQFFGMEISPFPTVSRKIMKYIPTKSLEELLDPKKFQSVDNYSVVFVNIEDLSYHNFENILNLDYLFDDVSFDLSSNQLGKEVKYQSFEMKGSMDTLLSLDSLNYYTIPLNNSQRGGKRLIFHSNKLSFALTKMIESSSFFNKFDFSHVNNVFRLNNFAPGDKKFKSHYDTPFADKSNDLYSKYTMIIYLTGNNGPRKDGTTYPPPLRIADINFAHIKPNQCIIFNQMFEHEGNAYDENDKIFIRTELIYKIKGFKFDKNIAEMFNRACYMTKELEQQQYSADLFNNCVKMRYKQEKEKIPRVYLTKSNLSTLYVTDGNYYYFSNKIYLESIAMLIILDYFNAKLYGINNIKIKSKPLIRNKTQESQEEDITDDYIFNLIESATFGSYNGFQKKIEFFQDIDKFIPDSLCEDFNVFSCKCGSSSDESITIKPYFDYHKKKSMDQVQRILDKNTVLIFNNSITINYDNILVKKDKKKKSDELSSGHIQLSDFSFGLKNKINFASCQCEFENNEEVLKEGVLYAQKKIFCFCLPNIEYQEYPNGFKLSIDIFNNGFVYSSTDEFYQPYTSMASWYNKKHQRRYDFSDKVQIPRSVSSEVNSDEDEEDFDEDEEDSDQDEKDESQDIQIPPYKKVG